MGLGGSHRASHGEDGLLTQGLRFPAHSHGPFSLTTAGGGLGLLGRVVEFPRNCIHLAMVAPPGGPDHRTAGWGQGACEVISAPAAPLSPHVPLPFSSQACQTGPRRHPNPHPHPAPESPPLTFSRVWEMTHHDRELSPRERERAPAELPGASPGGSALWRVSVGVKCPS